MPQPGALGSRFGPQAINTCPYCGREVQFVGAGEQTLLQTTLARAPMVTNTGHNAGSPGFAVLASKCGACEEFLIEMGPTEHVAGPNGFNLLFTGSELIHPKARVRPAPPAEVPAPLAADYNEAAACEPHSARAAAALARRCLQHTLRVEGFNQHDLYDQIEAAEGSGKVPTGLAELMHALRQIGNFAVHPNKSRVTGDLLEVEPDELETIFSVLDELFDLWFVQKAKRAALMAKLNAKLAKPGAP